MKGGSYRVLTLFITALLMLHVFRNDGKHERWRRINVEGKSSLDQNKRLCLLCIVIRCDQLIVLFHMTELR